MVTRRTDFAPDFDRPQWVSKMQAAPKAVNRTVGGSLRRSANRSIDFEMAAGLLRRVSEEGADVLQVSSYEGLPSPSDDYRGHLGT